MNTIGTSPAGEAWRPFLEGLRSFVARRVPRQEVDDVTQDILLRLYQGSSRLRDAERAESWVYAIARRAIADFYRRRPPDSGGIGEPPEDLPSDQDTEPGGFASFPGSHTVHEEVLSWMRPMAEELPERYRRPLILADFEGRPQREVAAELGLSLSGAKTRVQRARALLGQALHRCCEVSLDTEGRAVDFRRRECDC